MIHFIHDKSVNRLFSKILDSKYVRSEYFTIDKDSVNDNILVKRLMIDLFNSIDANFVAIIVFEEKKRRKKGQLIQNVILLECVYRAGKSG